MFSEFLFFLISPNHNRQLCPTHQIDHKVQSQDSDFQIQYRQNCTKFACETTRKTICPYESSVETSKIRIVRFFNQFGVFSEEVCYDQDFFENKIAISFYLILNAFVRFKKSDSIYFFYFI